MAHFQTVSGKQLPGTRLFCQGDSGVEKIVLQTGSEVVLEQHGGVDPATKNLPQLDWDPAKVTILNVKKSGNKQTFTLKAIAGGQTSLKGKDPAGNDVVDALLVTVGDFKNHANMDIDLLADVCRGSDAARIHAIHRLLNNNQDNLFNENSEANVKQWGALACGTVAKVGGRKVIYPKTDYDDTYATFHKPVKQVNGRDDVKYDANTVNNVRQAIKRRLQKGIPVLVGMAYAPTTKMLDKGSRLKATLGGGHTVLIVGCNNSADRFLYVDPFPTMSRLLYKGGVAIDPFVSRCDFLGELFVDHPATRSCPVIRQTTATQGTITAGNQYMEIISGSQK